MRPINNNIYVEPFPPEASKALHIPPVFLRKGQTVQRGTVKATSSDSVKLGDVIVFNKYSGDEIEYKNKKMVMIKPSSIIAVE